MVSDERLREAALARCRVEHIEPPGRLDRVVAAARAAATSALCARTVSRLPAEVAVRLERLGMGVADQTGEEGRRVLLTELKADPARLGLETFLGEVTKLERLGAIGMPADVFGGVSDRVVEAWRARAATEYPSDLADHPREVRLTLLAALCHSRRAEITDGLVDLLIALVHKVKTRAEQGMTDRPGPGADMGIASKPAEPPRDGGGDDGQPVQAVPTQAIGPAATQRTRLTTGQDSAMDDRKVAPGVFRLGDRFVNWWAVVDGGRCTLIDAGLRGHWSQLPAVLAQVELRLDDVEAVILTHAHADHAGCLPQLGTAKVLLHHQDRPLVDSPPSPPLRAVLQLWRPALLMAMVSYLRAGALARPEFGSVQFIDDDSPIELPGRPRLVHAPGHTPGSAIVLLEPTGTVFSGDALVTLDPFTGRRGPRLLTSFDNMDHQAALASLGVVARSGASLVLPGHGEPYRGSASEAARQAALISRH